MSNQNVSPPRELIDLHGSLQAPGNCSPAVRVGSHVYVSGMIAMRDGAFVGTGDAAGQTRAVLENIEDALVQAGATLGDIVRYRIYLTNIDDLADVRSALAPVFGAIRPAGTLVAVSALIHPDLKIEIDVDAVIGSARNENGSESK